MRLFPWIIIFVIIIIISFYNINIFLDIFVLLIFF